MSENIEGIGVLRHPEKVYQDGRSARDVAREIAEKIKPGGMITLPNTRDYTGAYEWDFRVEPVSAVQLEVERADCDRPTIVEGKQL